MRPVAQRTAPDKIATAGLLIPATRSATLLAGLLPVQLRARYPEIRITAFIRTASWSDLDLLSGIDDVYVLPDGNPLAASDMLRRHPMDVLIDMSRGLTSALLGRLSGPHFQIGFDGAPLRSLAQDATIAWDRASSDLENFRRLTQPLGTPATGTPVLDPGIATDALARGMTRTIVLHPWTRTRRDWPMRNWVQLGQTLADEGYTICIAGDAADHPGAKALAAAIDHADVQILAGVTTLRQTATLIARSVCLIGANADLLHLANLLGTPLVGLLDYSGASRWQSLHESAAILTGTPSPAEVLRIYRDIARPHNRIQAPARV